MNQILEEISNIGVVPVVAIDHKDDAAPLADALTKGGLPCAEVTFRTPAAEESIRIMAEQFPDMPVSYTQLFPCFLRCKFFYMF